MINRIVIVGGGTAGWLAAGLIAAEYCKKNNPLFTVTLVESPEISTIGVGEGTWPTMRTTLKKIGLSESQFLDVCNASFKQGSKFIGWRTGMPGDAYHHPFSLPNGYLDSNVLMAWQQNFSSQAFAEVVTAQVSIAEAGLAPKQKTTPEYAGVVNYGYHLDAGRFAALLQSHCVEKLGVRHVLDHVVSVNSLEDGGIANVETRNSGLIEGDLFVDCTGSACLLLGKHLGVPFVDLSGYSINDTALAMQVPYLQEDAPIASCTLATAQTAGWIWDIGLTHRRGVGYVYSSAHITEDQAIVDLHRYLEPMASSQAIAHTSIKKITIQPGHRQVFWKQNCVAVGMAAGFIEPLEASALALVELSVNAICEELTCAKRDMVIVAKRFNQLFLYRWKRIVEFLKLHYVLSDRMDSSYWADVKSLQTAPNELVEQLALWAKRPPSLGDLLHSAEIFPSASYLYVLAGMGFYESKPLASRLSDNYDKALMYIKDSAGKKRQYGANLPVNRALLNHVSQFGFYKI